MPQLDVMDLLAAAAGQPTSRELTPEDLEILARYKQFRRDLLFQPPCECKICLRQYSNKDDQNYIYWHYFGHTVDPASLAQSYAKAIKQDRDFLYQKILESAPALLKRWRSGEAKRREILVKAQPDIYPYSQPLIDIASREQKLEEARKHRGAYLLPYINIEDLSKDSVNFIRLLHHRTTYPPQDWVHFDNAQLQPAWRQGGLEEKSAEGCVMVSDEEYGIWKDFDELAVHRGDSYGAIRGLLILDAQQRLMSFLRKMVATILKDSSASKLNKEVSDGTLTSVPFPRYDLKTTGKWTRFVDADMHRDKPWLSAASLYTQRPYSTPPSFDIDAMIEIAETKAMEAADELWLLQTDPDYFHELMRRHEREWFDAIPRVQDLKSFSPKDKADNIGYIMTLKMVIQARDWGWALEECRTLKQLMGGSGANTSAGKLLPPEYMRVLCGLHYLLLKAQSWYQTSLSQLFLKSRDFHSIREVIGIGKNRIDNWVLGFNFKDYPQLYKEDRLGWCLYNLTKDANGWNTFERSVVLQHLEKFLESCSPQDRERIDHEMYKCISDMAAVERMLSIVGLHRPEFAHVEQNPFHQRREAWLVHSRLLIRPLDWKCERLDLDSTLGSSASFRMPTGRRDEQWLIERDRAHQNLGRLWKRAKDAYQKILEALEVPPDSIETQLAMMKQGDSLENKAQLDLEKRQILSHLEAARQRTLAKSMVPRKDTPGGYLMESDHPADRSQKPAKEKAKTRPDALCTSASLHTRFATAFTDLAIDEEIHEAEESTPILYTLERESITLQVISLMFPDRSNGIEVGGKTVDWLEFVSTMNALGFGAEHRGGSAFTFKGAIKLPHDPSTLHKRSISVHMPHPSTEMGPILLQSLGRRCNRRFGWQRGNFAIDEKVVDHGN